MNESHENSYKQHLARRHRIGRIFTGICFASTWFGVVVLAVLIGGVLLQAAGLIDWQFITSYDSDKASESGILAGLWGSFWLIFYTAAVSVPVGVGAAIYLEEFAPDNRLTKLIQVNLANLAGVPSIVYGILGLTVFVRLSDLRQSVLAGALTLSLLILPVVIVAAQEALRAVPSTIRHASLALGATPWQTIRHQVLPAATPGILTGVILAISRAIGETAPLIIVGVKAYIDKTPGRIESVSDVVSKRDQLAFIPFDSFTTLPIQIWGWASDARSEFQQLAAAGIIVLLAVLLLLNTAAIVIRNKYRKSSRW